MENKINGLSFLLNTISNETAHDLLNLYKENSYNLTDTARKLALPISTVQDNLKKLIQSRLLFVREKKYHVSSLGDYLLTKLNEIEPILRLQNFFGDIPADLIPHQFIEHLLPFIKEIDIQETSWHFFNIIDKLLSKFKEEIDEGTFKGEIRVLGWWSLEFDLALLKTYFPDRTIDMEFYLTFFKNVRFHQITDKKFVEELRNHEFFQDMKKYLEMEDNIRIMEDITFNFTIMEIEGSMCFFLVRNDDVDIQHHFILENPKSQSIFNSIFTKYQEKSLSLHDYLEKS